MAGRPAFIFENILAESGVTAYGCVLVQDLDFGLLVKLDSLTCTHDDVRTLAGERASARGFSLTALNPLPPLLQLPQPRQGPPRLFSEDHSCERGCPRNALLATSPAPGARRKDKYRKTLLLQRQYRVSGLMRLLPRVSCSWLSFSFRRL